MNRKPDRVTAIVLAGGQSRRFGRDKLAESIEGRPLLHHAVASVIGVADEVIVVLAPGAQTELPAGVTIVHDPAAFEGPLVGLLAGLQVATSSTVLVVGGDMPGLQSPVARALLDAVGMPGTDAAVLIDDGRPRPLPLAIRRDAALPAAARIVEAGDRRLGALQEALGAREIAESVWRAVDPDGRSTLDIDSQADLP